MLYLHIFHYNEKILKARAYLVWFTALFPETKVLGKSCLLKKKKKNCSHAQIRASKSIGLPQNESPYLKGMLSIPQI